MIYNFLHIGKTGGTALRHALEGVEIGKGDSFAFHKHATRLADIPIGDKVIFVLRDPINRFFSSYYSRRRKGYPRYKFEWTEQETLAFHNFSRPEDIVRGALKRSDSSHYKTAIQALNSIKHVNQHIVYWFGSLEYLQYRMKDIYYVGFQETLGQDFEALKYRLGLRAELCLPKSDVDAHRNPPYNIPVLSASEIQFLKSWYLCDYEIYNYCRSLTFTD